MPESAMINVCRKARGSTVMFFQTRLAFVIIQSTRAMMVRCFDLRLNCKSPLLKIQIATAHLVSQPEHHFRSHSIFLVLAHPGLASEVTTGTSTGWCIVMIPDVITAALSPPAQNWFLLNGWPGVLKQTDYRHVWAGVSEDYTFDDYRHYPDLVPDNHKLKYQIYLLTHWSDPVTQWKIW